LFALAGLWGCCLPVLAGLLLLAFVRSMLYTGAPTHENAGPSAQVVADATVTRVCFVHVHQFVALGMASASTSVFVRRCDACVFDQTGAP